MPGLGGNNMPGLAIHMVNLGKNRDIKPGWFFFGFGTWDLGVGSFFISIITMAKGLKGRLAEWRLECAAL